MGPHLLFVGKRELPRQPAELTRENKHRGRQWEMFVLVIYFDLYKNTPVGAEIHPAEQSASKLLCTEAIMF